MPLVYGIVEKFGGGKKHCGYQTSNLVGAVVLKGKYQGLHVGRVQARATRYFDLTTSAGKAFLFSIVIQLIAIVI
ncbi:hypothetical protein KSF_006850 [Reticulibacter mediterranei]|uniref:Uncharacterized protein n=1 Tax=Reticulibacter mediterranei TaxID=2778369 RepID=A0A8J3MY83_9CHLR|nr:hypothetical protein KSF_006850 [Reticulibacter mediterranei]